MYYALHVALFDFRIIYISLELFLCNCLLGMAHTLVVMFLRMLIDGTFEQ